MAWQTPTIGSLVTDTVRAFDANLPGADASLERNNLRPVAKVFAGGLFELHRFADWAARQRFVLTSDADQLDRHGAEMKPPVPRKGADKARGLVVLTTDGPASLTTGAVLARSDGVQFSVDAGIVLDAAGSAGFAVTAMLAGGDGVTGAGAALSIVSGLTGAGSCEVSAGGLGGGADRELDEPYRARLLFAKAFPEHGGAPADWLRYTLAQAGVTRAFVEPLGHGRGTVVVYPFFDLTRPHGIGLESDRVAIQNALLALGPGAGLPVVRIPEAVPIDVTYSGLSPATPEVRQAVVAEIATTFFRNSRVAGVATPHPSMPFLASTEVFSRSWLWQAAANATGEHRHSVLVPTTDTLLTPGQVAVPGVVAFS